MQAIGCNAYARSNMGIGATQKVSRAPPPSPPTHAPYRMVEAANGEDVVGRSHSHLCRSVYVLQKLRQLGGRAGQARRPLSLEYRVHDLAVL